MSISAMKQALEALEGLWDDGFGGVPESMHKDAITALRQAIAEAEKQEPVAWMTHTNDLMPLFHKTRKSALNWETQPTPLYAAPVHASDISQERVDKTAKREHEFECPRCGHCCQQREWVGLAEQDVHDAFQFTELIKQLSFERERPEWCENFAAYIEAKLKEKNA